MKIAAAGHPDGGGRNVKKGKGVSWGGWEGGRPRRSGERGDPTCKHQDKSCARGGPVWKDGEGAGPLAAGVGGTHTLDRTVWRGAEQGGGAERRAGPARRNSGAPRATFPRRRIPTPTPGLRGRGPHIWRSWTTYQGAREPVGAASCQAGVPVRRVGGRGRKKGGGGGADQKPGLQGCALGAPGRGVSRV